MCCTNIISIQQNVRRKSAADISEQSSIPVLDSEVKNIEGQIKLYIYKTLWLEFASELYRPSDRRLSAKLVPTFVDRRCHMVSTMDPYAHNLGFLDWTNKIIRNLTLQ
jgi:hypothetical protein